MIFILGSQPPADVRVVMVRSRCGRTEFFCVGDVPESTPLHDGWYADDTGGGIAVWGAGRYWEVRPTPFTVTLTDADVPS
jgi:hypothetical protein